MDENPDEETSFSLFFPSRSTKDLDDILRSEERLFAVIGETVDLVLLAKYDGQNTQDEHLASWRDSVMSMCSSVSLTAAYNETGAGSDVIHRCNRRVNSVSSVTQDGGRLCEAIASYKEKFRPKARHKQRRQKWHILDDTTLLLPLVVVVEQLPSCCEECVVVVALWSPQLEDTEHAEVGYLEAFLKFSPEDVLRDRCRGVRQIVSSKIQVLTPPTVTCRHVSVAGKHYMFVKVINTLSSEVTVHESQVLPHTADTMPTIVSDPIHGQENEVTSDSDSEAELDANSVGKVDVHSCSLPVCLSCWEQHTMLFELRVQHIKDLASLLDQDIALIALVRWTNRSSQAQQHHIVTQYRLPSIRIRKPGMTITASCDTDINTKKSFEVKYTITNNLQNFLALKLLWSPEKAIANAAKCSDEQKRKVEEVMNNVVCHQPSSHLGACKLGSTVSVCIGFQMLRPGMFEVGQHMKLNLQYAIGSLSNTQRRDSNTSTQSMPGESRQDAQSTASSSPLKHEAGDRRDSCVSGRSVSSAPTPTDLSPVHGMHPLGHSSSSLHLPSNTTVMPRSSSTLPTSFPQAKSDVPVITPQHVLKRNCQVYLI